MGKGKPAGHKLPGKISNRIRDGRIPADALPVKRPPVDDRPSPAAVRRAEGHGLGNPARSDRTAQTHDE